jgi:aryl-alcohol dehydrogenase-like predicted oxidoreductase
MHDAVTCAIPGGKNPSQVIDNVNSAELPALTGETMKRIRHIYDQHISAAVHQRW